ncbi:hypothetical protein Mgra_00005619 [Meloidogyne graminicola]|uniref:RRM domain-containing protein n=1 Tax=Meloidogyne graminicola TaxID=189291 RepID=A0A8S9ZP11_9BILA|nr:hypothetical protein Mgra_00005619 [Meloidogyne graminicola]
MPPVLSICPVLTPLRVFPLFSPQPTTQPSQYRKLFIGGLTHETTDEELCDYYSKWGQVVDCIVIRDPISRHSRGFGFVTFALAEMADAAMSERPHTVGGKIVDPKRAIPREQMLQAATCPPTFLDSEPDLECKLILSGILWDYHTVDALRLYFERFGELEQVEILGNPRGFGFIVFEERSSAKLCLEKNPHLINGKEIEAKMCCGNNSFNNNEKENNNNNGEFHQKRRIRRQTEHGYIIRKGNGKERESSKN